MPLVADGEPPAPSARRLPERVVLLLHLFLSFVICNMDRINLSVAIVPMGDALHWTSTTRGVVQACFFAGYMLTQIPGGRLADRVGGRRVLAAGVAAWSALTIATPPAARMSLPALLTARVLLGVAEGVAMPAVNAAVAAWTPAQETARALSFIYSGMYAGSILGLILAPTLLAAAGWPSVFYAFGAIGLMWVTLFVATTADTPAQSRRISPEELEYIQSNAPAAGGAYGRLPTVDGEKSANANADTPTLREIFARPCVWAIIVAHFCSTWGYFVLLTWLPSYLTMRFHLDVSKSSLLSTAPWVSMFACANISGVCADGLIARGFNRTYVRKCMQSIAFLGPAVFLVLLARAEHASAAVGYVSAALALAAVSNSGVYSNHQDIGPQIAGTLLGVSNTFASIPGIVGVSVTGVILDHTDNNWAAVFYLAIAFYLLGFFVYSIFATSERQW